MNQEWREDQLDPVVCQKDVVCTSATDIKEACPNLTLSQIQSVLDEVKNAKSCFLAVPALAKRGAVNFLWIYIANDSIVASLHPFSLQFVKEQGYNAFFVEEALKYAEQNWPEALSDAKITSARRHYLVEYCSSFRHLGHCS